MGIPKEIGEAAYLDGCNQWQTFYKVMFPLTGTSIVRDFKLRSKDSMEK